MRRSIFRIWSRLLCLGLALSLCLGGTLAWRSLDQSARNDIRRERTAVPVELVKLEKKGDGTVTEKPIPGAEFYLFTQGGEQLGGRYTTDEQGRIVLALKPGSYYFDEAYPALGYEFDKRDGERVTRYPFVVEGREDKVTVTAYNIRQTGSLRLRKEVKNESGAALSEEQQNLSFAFTVTFTDGESHPCQVDGGEPQLIPSGGTIRLKDGQSALFPDLPVGLGYSLTEAKAAGYSTSSVNSQGNITRGEREAVFTNVWGRPYVDDPVLVVSKALAGEYPEKDLDKEFRFVLTVEGESTEFTLKAGESKEFKNVSFGDAYSVTEADVFPEGYALTEVSNGAGTISHARTEAAFVNTWAARPRVEISGEKTWVLNGADEALIPASIPVRLYGNGLLVEEKTVRADEAGRWLYSFTAPEKDRDGKAIEYTVREGPVDHFLPGYKGYDIVNTYTPGLRVDPPILEKVVEGYGAPRRRFEFMLRSEGGAPLPDGASGTAKRYALDGSGRVELGWFTFTRPGTYRYEIYEVTGSGENWVYDTARYTLTFLVTAKDGALAAERNLVRNGAAADRLRFRNRYLSSDNSVGGGDDDDKRPAPSEVESGALTPELATSPSPAPTATQSAAPEPTPTELTLTESASTPPAAVPTPAPTAPPPDVPKTGDTNELPVWLAVMFSGTLGLTLCPVYLFWRKHRYVGKRLMKR